MHLVFIQYFDQSDIGLNYFYVMLCTGFNSAPCSSPCTAVARLDPG